jgi:hypothetical protein
MSEVITIRSGDENRLQNLSEQLAGVYKVAFAGDPWYEVSRCLDESCFQLQGFSRKEVGSTCSCGDCLVDAYNALDLLEGWMDVLRQDGIMEVKLNEDSDPIRVTIARPTNPAELYQRKYSNVPLMEDWLKSVLPEELLWIEDTFADRVRSPTGNLSDREETFELLEKEYGLPIATRTLAPAIVRATLRDRLPRTRVWVGSQMAGSSVVNEAFNNPGYPLPRLPDTRTFMLIG